MKKKGIDNIAILLYNGKMKIRVFAQVEKILSKETDSCIQEENYKNR